MASHPDPNPDSPPPDESDDVERVSPDPVVPEEPIESVPERDGEDRAQ